MSASSIKSYFLRNCNKSKKTSYEQKRSSIIPSAQQKSKQKQGYVVQIKIGFWLGSSHEQPDAAEWATVINRSRSAFFSSVPDFSTFFARSIASYI